jgi:electron transfer flavoprotein alpha subunit
LLIAEHDNKKLDASTLQAIGAATKLPGSDKLDLLVLGKGCKGVADEVAAVAGVNQVILAESDQLEHPLADTMTELLVSIQKDKGYSVIAGATSSICKEALPRLAAKLDVQPVSDVVGVVADDTFVRPMYAGNALATVKSSDSVKILTFRPTSFEAAALGSSKAAVETLATSAYESAGINWISDSESTSDKPQLASAKRVVAGGRGLKNGENFTTVLEPLCDKLNAAMGATRAAVDAGFVPNEMQVGQTGKVVAPELYVAVGISGAIQHLAGMKDSKTIVALNKDADAPIFQVADYGLVGDLFETVPEFTSKA